MSRRAARKLTTVFFTVLSLLFSQLALARYVCPQQAHMAAMASMLQAGTPCVGMDSQLPGLCHQHSADAGQSFEAVKLPTASQPLLIQVLALPLLAEADEVSAMPPGAVGEAHPPPDPLFLATLRLRV
ncbi:hypothetical protein [Roseateles sp.]|uniref:hypothetical protein n=1 Tax=Roseateles sp. TaxID=1971397 RepID=UPI0032677617